MYDIEYRTVSPQGEVRWVRATGRTYYKEEKPVRFDGTTQDITDRKRVEEERKQLLPEIINAAMEGVKPTAETKGVRLEKVIDRLVGPVSGDPGRLQQVLWNLLTNAIKFTSKGGKVCVLAEGKQSYVEISVTDTGEGIIRDFLPHLFERFSQADGSAKVALSAYVRAEDRIRSAQNGYQTHLAKPVEPAELLAVIAGLAGRYERTAQE